jgi:acetoin utilization deacetylase AcuC-like enzyme
VTSPRTGYVYDPVFLKHAQAGHPEGPERLQAAFDGLDAAGLLGCLDQVRSRAAGPEELLLAHATAHIERAQAVSRSGGGYLDPDTYTNRHTFDAAALAAGSVIDLTLAVVSGRLRNGMALVRPPGHHALRNQFMGFCIFNNIALAALAARQRGGLKRVAIVDFDVHHGNGTQDIFEADPDVLYVSSHQYPFFPGTGRADETGRGPAIGTKINLPLPSGFGDEGFAELYEQIVFPALTRFGPQLILVSAGYDGHWADPLAGLRLSLSSLAAISAALVRCAERLCRGQIVFTLEGGYDLDVVGAGVANSVKALLGRDDFDDPLGAVSSTVGGLSEYIARIKRIHGLA